MLRFPFLLSLLLTAVFSLRAQAPANDECINATVISDPSNFCSLNPGEDNSLATPSPQVFPNCFITTPFTDVWYRFTAVAPDVLITVKGNSQSNPTGTLFNPEIALYNGDCNNLNLIGCVADQFGTNVKALYVTNLIVGQTYYIRIDGAVGGKFSLCVKNEATIPIVSGDCPTATFVCSKNPIHVEEIFGPGNDAQEVNGAPCFSGTGESSSGWYVFTAANNGNLEFTITPNDPADDIDFIVYELPNGVGDCNGKVIKRCMGAGDFDPASPCMGPTGLNATATDISQPFGCAPGMDNFLRFLPLESGHTYALMLNDFSSIGNGFTIEWGGTAQFKGPATAYFVTDEPDKKLCTGEELVVTDSSHTDQGAIISWHWDFGTGASPDTIGQAGPHTVKYQTPGPKSILLTVTTTDGCSSQDTVLLLVEPCCTIDAAVSVTAGCPHEPNPTPATATAVVHNYTDPVHYFWSNGQSGSDSTAHYFTSGMENVIVLDGNFCSDTVYFNVNTPANVNASFPADTSIIQGQSIQLAVSGTPANTLQAWWINEQGDTLNGKAQTFMPAETITYFVVANNAGCVFSDSVTIKVKTPSNNIPNAFTPNGDGANDTFGPVFVGFTPTRLEVWSRWGDKVFDSDLEGKFAWDGTINGLPAPSDVYVYRLRYLSPGNEASEASGDVTLLR